MAALSDPAAARIELLPGRPVRLAPPEWAPFAAAPLEVGRNVLVTTAAGGGGGGGGKPPPRRAVLDFAYLPPRIALGANVTLTLRDLRLVNARRGPAARAGARGGGQGERRGAGRAAAARGWPWRRRGGGRVGAMQRWRCDCS
jgi:hypothetical protein